jgi:hypothetical protein
MNLQNNSFVLKPDGAYWIEKMPFHPTDNDNWEERLFNAQQFEKDMESAIHNAIRVSNQGEVKLQLHTKFEDSEGVWSYEYDKPYSLLCSVEKREESFYEHVYIGHAKRIVKTVALVTFPESGEKQSQEETQEQLWKEMQDLYRSVRDMHGIQYVTPALMSKFTITRK